MGGIGPLQQREIAVMIGVDDDAPFAARALQNFGDSTQFLVSIAILSRDPARQATTIVAFRDGAHDIMKTQLLSEHARIEVEARRRQDQMVARRPVLF